MRQAIGPLIDLLIAKLLTLEQHRGRIWSAGRLSFEPNLNGGRLPAVRDGIVQFDKKVLPLCRVHQRNSRQGPVGILDGCI